jgi:periplasmic protein TonB
MSLWQGVLVSVLFHAALFCVPVAVNITRELSSCEEMRFVIEEGSRESRASEETQGPVTAAGPAPGPPAQPMSEPTPQPEESRDTFQVENEPPLPEDEPEPTMLAMEVPKPPQPVPKPRRPAVKPPRQVEPRKVEPRSKTVLEDAVPPSQPSAQQPGSEPGQGENGSQDTAAHSSTSGGGGTPSYGPVDSSFGSGDGPRFLSKALPKYPRLARELGKEGTVLLRLTIDERGCLLDVQVVKQAGTGFDEEAVLAVRSSKFSPAKRGGKPVACRAHLPIRFVLRSSEND